MRISRTATVDLPREPRPRTAPLPAPGTETRPRRDLLRAVTTIAAVAVIGVASLAGCTSTAHSNPSGPAGSAASSAKAGKAPVAKVEVEANKAQLSVRLKKSEIVHVVLPPADESNGQLVAYHIQPSGSNVLVPVSGFPGYFKGAEAGTVTISAQQTPPCSPGKSCDAHTTDVGSVSVTVSN